MRPYSFSVVNSSSPKVKIFPVSTVISSASLPLQLTVVKIVGNDGVTMKATRLANTEPYPETRAEAPPRLQLCPVCHRPSDHLKESRLYDFVLFLVIFGAIARTARYTACPACMRKLIIKKTLINIVPAHIAWPVIFVIHAVQFVKTYTGSQQQMPRPAANPYNAPPITPEHGQQPSLGPSNATRIACGALLAVALITLAISITMPFITRAVSWSEALLAIVPASVCALAATLGLTLTGKK